MTADPSLVALAKERVGTTLNEKWHLDELLGLGGMAAVYAATHRNRSRAAIKVLHPQLAVQLVMRERFRREGYVANTVEHPGAVRVLDDDIDPKNQTAYLVVELLEGESLEARVQSSAGIPYPTLLKVCCDVLDVLSAAHARGVVHRDIKPENVFLLTDGQGEILGTKLLDFGVARLLEEGVGSGTLTGNTMGTPAFMAPEQAEANWSEVDARTDIWAVGATLFYLISGRYVHQAGNANMMLIRAATREAPGLLEVAPQADTDLALVVDRALAFKKQDRFESAAEMKAALAALLGELGPAASERLVSSPRSSQSSSSSSAESEGPTLVSPSNPTSGATLASAAFSSSEGAPQVARRPRWAYFALAGAVAAGAVALALWEPSAPPEQVGDSKAAAEAPAVSPSVSPSVSPEVEFRAAAEVSSLAAPPSLPAASSAAEAPSSSPPPAASARSGSAVRGPAAAPRREVGAPAASPVPVAAPKAPSAGPSGGVGGVPAPPAANPTPKPDPFERQY